MKYLILCVINCITINSAVAQLNIAAYVFPEKIMAIYYSPYGSSGTEIAKQESRIMYLRSQDRIRFERMEFFEGNVTAKVKQNFIFNDSVIFLLNQTTIGLAGTKQFTFRDDNIFIKIPRGSEKTKWTTDEGLTMFKCEARMEKRKHGNELVSALIIEKTPIEDGKLHIDFKSEVVYIVKVGLYEERLFKTNKILYQMSKIETIK